MFSQEVINQYNAHKTFLSSRGLLDNECKWCKVHLAETINCYPLYDAKSVDAFALCLAGAVSRFAPTSKIKFACFEILDRKSVV